jgi:hypothetical protein
MHLRDLMTWGAVKLYNRYKIGAKVLKTDLFSGALQHHSPRIIVNPSMTGIKTDSSD